MTIQPAALSFLRLHPLSAPSARTFPSAWGDGTLPWATRQHLQEQAGLCPLRGDGCYRQGHATGQDKHEPRGSPLREGPRAVPRVSGQPRAALGPEFTLCQAPGYTLTFQPIPGLPHPRAYDQSQGSLPSPPCPRPIPGLPHAPPGKEESGTPGILLTAQFTPGAGRAASPRATLLSPEPDLCKTLPL